MGADVTDADDGSSDVTVSVIFLHFIYIIFLIYLSTCVYLLTDYSWNKQQPSEMDDPLDRNLEFLEFVHCWKQLV